MPFKSNSKINTDKEKKMIHRTAMAAAIAAALAPSIASASYDAEIQVADPSSGSYSISLDSFNYGTELHGAAGNVLLYWDDDNPSAETTWGKELVVTKLDNFEADNVIDVEIRSLHFAGVSSLAAGDNMILFKVQDLNGNTLSLVSTSAPYTLGTVLQGTGTVSLAKSYDANTSDDSVKYTIATVSGSSSGTGSGGSSSSGSSDTGSGGGTSSSSSGSSSSGSGSSSGSSAASGSSGTISSTAGLGLSVQPQTRAASLAMSAATLAGQASASNAAIALERLALSAAYGIQTFGTLGGGYARQDFGGDHVGLSIFNLTAGVGDRMQLSNGAELSFGGFVESGYGKFDSHYGAGIAEGRIGKKGHVRYTGLGFGLRAVSASGWHAGAIARAGGMKSKQNGALYSAALGSSSGFEISTPYYGATLGGGKIIPAGDSADVDVRGSASWLHQDGDRFNAFGDTYKLGSVDSVVLKAGAQYERRLSGAAVLYAGAGWQQQLGGKADLKVRAAGDNVWYSADSSEVKGGSAYAQFGVKANPKGGLNLDIAIGGYAGADARGASARAQAMYLF